VVTTAPPVQRSTAALSFAPGLLTLARRTGDLLLGVRFLLLVASALILATLVWSLRQTPNALLAYADVPTHLNLARRFHDDLYPGLGQFGDYWLPLAHIIELPFIWNDTLWHTGLAGAIPSMLCYLLSVWCIYQLMLISTGQRLPGTIAGLAFATNPNVLYLHVLAMFEPVMIATMLVATYFLAGWLRSGDLSLLVATAAVVSLSTITRYELWGYTAGSTLVVGVALWQMGRRRWMLFDQLLVYVMLAWYLVFLWLIWNLSLSGDPIYFLHPSFNNGLGEVRLAVLTKRHVLRATAYSVYAALDNAGPILVFLAVLGLWRMITTFGTRTQGLWFYVLATPLAFDIFYLWFKGTPPILVTELIPYTNGNVRYGIMTVPLICLLVGYLSHRPVRIPLSPRLVRRASRALYPLWFALQLALLVAVVAQPLLLIRQHAVVSYNEPNTPRYRADQQVRTVLGQWLGKHYTDGRILMSTFKGADRIILASGLPDRDFVHEGSQQLWKCALRRPQRWVRWVVLYRGRDSAAQLLSSKAVAGGEYFTRILTSADGGQYFVFRRNSRPWIAPHKDPCE
jgi:hypothetical protein